MRGLANVESLSGSYYLQEFTSRTHQLNPESALIQPSHQPSLLICITSASKDFFVLSISFLGTCRGSTSQPNRRSSDFFTFLFCTYLFSTYQQGPTPHWGCRWKCPHLSFAGPAASHCGSRSRTLGRTSAHRTETSARRCNRCSSGCLQTNVAQ